MASVVEKRICKTTESTEDTEIGNIKRYRKLGDR